MRTNSLQRFNNTRRKRFAIVFVALALMGIVYLVPEPFGAFSSLLLRPLHSARIWFNESSHVLPSYFRDRSAFLHEIDELKAALGNAEQRAIEGEARRADAVYQNAPQGEGRVTASVLRAPGDTPYDTLVIAAGSKAEVPEGALVYADGAAIGTVAQVYPDISIVVLFSTPGVRVPVYLWGASVFAQGEGIGGGAIRIGIPQGLPVAEGDAITIPVPGTAIFGRVDHVVSDATNPEQYVFATQHRALRSLRVVSVDRSVLPQVTRAEAEQAINDVRNGVVVTPLETLLEEIPVTATTTASSTPQP